MTKSFALDLLSRQAWCVENTQDGIGNPQTSSEWLPSALLPLRRSEVFRPGVNLEAHRRGRGLLWPPEAQVPVLNKPAFGIGRIPMAAVLEFLVCQEREWGKLEQMHVSWSPDGRDQVPIGIRHLIGQSIMHHVPALRASQGGVLGLVVPSLLQPAGQQVVIDACLDKGTTPLLVPTHMAAAIAWGHSPAASPYLERATPGEGTLVGHLLIIDAGLGPWVTVRVPLMAVINDSRSWLVPVRHPRRCHTVLSGPTGWQILSLAARQSGDDWLARMYQGSWLNSLLSGNDQLPHDALIASTGSGASGVASLCGLESGRRGTMRELLESVHHIPTSNHVSDPGHCVGCLIIGTIADMRIIDASVRDHLSRSLGVPVHPLAPNVMACGAAWAAFGFSQQPKWPTWRESLEPLELYCIGKDRLGDPEQHWIPLIKATSVAAGTDYQNDQPIRGISLECGHTQVRMTLRRACDNSRNPYEYRAVFTKTVNDFQTTSNIPLEITVHARAGHGLAVVRVTGTSEARFDTTLDWMSMKAVSAPPQPKLGYIPHSIEIRAESNIYNNVVPTLRRIDATLERMPEAAKVIRADIDALNELAKTAVRGLNRVLSGKQVAMVYKYDLKHDDFIYYAAVSRDGCVPPNCNPKLLNSLASKVEAWLVRNARYYDECKSMRNMCAYFYHRCPVPVTRVALRRANEALSGKVKVDTADLRVLGLTTKNSEEFTIVYRLVVRVLKSSRTANNYLRALRDITRLNDDALSFTAMSKDVCSALTALLVEYLRWAESHRKSRVVSNCVEALLFMLKRRRYDSDYLCDTDQARIIADAVITRLANECLNQRMSWLTRSCVYNIERLRRFLSHVATEADFAEPFEDDVAVDDDDNGV